jgi:hypothetical protein
VSENRSDLDVIEIAREQLEVAIELFLSGRSYASALALAGAAEGRLLARIFSMKVP